MVLASRANDNGRGACKLIALVGMVIFSLTLAGSFINTGSLAASAPDYSTLYDRLLKLEQQGEIVQALRLVPLVYAADDIPVDAFYATLENKRQQLLNVMIERNIAFKVGSRKSSCSQMKALFDNRYIPRLETFRFFAEGANDLGYQRFCYLLIIEGDKLKNLNAGSFANPSATWIDLRSALDSSDPWLVSSALFVARKQDKPTISLQGIINRWQKRPDLWDERCTQQALSFFARFKKNEHLALHISNEDIKTQIVELQAIPDDESYLSPVLYSEQTNNIFDKDIPAYSLVTLKRNPNNKGMVKRWAGDANHFSNLEAISTRRLTNKDFSKGGIAVRPGWYRIKFNSARGMPRSGYYGKSHVIEVKKGELIFVPVMVFPAI